MNRLEVTGLCKQYHGRPAVDDLSFSVEAGEIFGLLGPNGAGKTTTMSMICGLVSPDRGEVRLDGRPIRCRDSVASRELGVVPQDLAIYPELTAAENLEFFARLYGLRGEVLCERIDAALGSSGLTPHASRRAGEFSGGMKRRLNFAIALLHRPGLLILDEPTVGVDPQSRAHLLESVRELARGGMAVVYASHYMDEVQTLCQRVGIIDHGRMLKCGPLDTLLAQLHPTVEIEITGWSNALEGKLAEFAQVRVITGNGNANAPTSFPNTTRLQLVPRDGELLPMLNGALQHLQDSRVALRSIQSAESNLEQLFLNLTGNRLRD